MRKTLEVVTAFMVIFLGITFAFGSLIAIGWERSGFGTRGGNLYLASLWFGLCASVAIPVVILYFIFPGIKKKWWVLLFALAALIVFSVLGVGF